MANETFMALQNQCKLYAKTNRGARPFLILLALLQFFAAPSTDAFLFGRLWYWIRLISQVERFSKSDRPRHGGVPGTRGACVSLPFSVHRPAPFPQRESDAVRAMIARCRARQFLLDSAQ